MKKITMKMVGVGLASVLAALTAAQAADVSTGWKNDVDGNWSVAGNWIGSSGATTGTTGIAYFNIAINGARTVTLDASPWTVNKLVFTNNSAGNAYGWTLTGGTLNLAGTAKIAVDGSSSAATVASALSGNDFIKEGTGALFLSGTNSVGVYDVMGRLVLSSGGAMIKNRNDFYFGSSGTSERTNSSVVVTGTGSTWDLGAKNIYCTPGRTSCTGAYNRVTIANGGVLTNGGFGFGPKLSAANPLFCSLAITNGGKVYAGGADGYGNSGNGCSILVGTGGQKSLWDVQNSIFAIGDARYVINTYNSITIDANGVVSNASGCSIGRTMTIFTHTIGNSLTVKNGGTLQLNASGLSVATWQNQGGGAQPGDAVSNAVLITGSGSRVTMTAGGIGLANSAFTTNTFASGNTLTVANGGLLEAVGTIAVGYNGQNTTSNTLTVADGGILQFTVAAPTITIKNYDSKYTDSAYGNGMVISNGTLSFRGITSGALPNLTNNLAKTGGFSTNNITWLGKNKLRLDSSSATNSATGGYVFEDNGKAYNYVGLELVNGETALRGSGVTIGGSVLFSNTTATVGCVFTNNGTMTVANSAVTFSSDLTLGAGCVVGLPSTNQMPVTVSGTLKVDGGTVNLPASLGTKDGFTLFTSPNVITGTVKALTLSSPTHQLVLTEGGKTLVVLPKRGTLISIF